VLSGHFAISPIRFAFGMHCDDDAVFQERRTDVAGGFGIVCRFFRGYLYPQFDLVFPTS